MRLPKPGLLPALRRYLALTQPRLATLLATSRVAVAQAEAGTRSLPPPPRRPSRRCWPPCRPNCGAP